MGSPLPASRRSTSAGAMPSPCRSKISRTSAAWSSRRVISSWSIPPSNRSSAEWLNGACPRSCSRAAARASRRSGTAGAGGQQALALGAQGVVDPAGQVHGPEHVAEAAVLGAGEDQEGEAELVDEAQALHRPAVDQRGLQRVGADETVDRVAERQHGRGRPGAQLCSEPRASFRYGRSMSITCCRLRRIESTERPRSGSDSLQELELAQGRQVHPRGDAVDQLFERAVARDEVVHVQGEAVPQLRGQRAQERDDALAHGHDAGVPLVEPGLFDQVHQPLPIGRVADLALQLEADLAVHQEVGVAVRGDLQVHDAGGGAFGKISGRPSGSREQPGFRRTMPIQRESSSSSLRSWASRT